MKTTTPLLLASMVLPCGPVTAVAKCPKAEITIKQTSDAGSYLADENGMTLYWYTKDSTGTSTCNGPCEAQRPAYYRDVFRIPKTMNRSDFGTILRSDGKKQLTFRGYPLYYWKGDRKTGDTGGIAPGGELQLVDPDNFPNR